MYFLIWTLKLFFLLLSLSLLLLYNCMTTGTMPARGHAEPMVWETPQFFWKPSEQQQGRTGQLPLGKQILSRNLWQSTQCRVAAFLRYGPRRSTTGNSIAPAHGRLMIRSLKSSWTTAPATTERYHETVLDCSWKTTFK